MSVGMELAAFCIVVVIAWLCRRDIMWVMAGVWISFCLGWMVGWFA